MAEFRFDFVDALCTRVHKVADPVDKPGHECVCQGICRAAKATEGNDEVYDRDHSFCNCYIYCYICCYIYCYIILLPATAFCCPLLLPA